MFSTNSHTGNNSHLYNSICSYLHNKNRAQPIIGLNSVTEIWTNNRPPVYFCDVCFLRVIKSDIRNHIMGSLHRYNYIKSHHAHGWRSYADLTLLARPLMDLAQMVEKTEGTGDVQVLFVDEVIYNEMTTWPVPAAFGKLERIKNQQDPNALQSFANNVVEGTETVAQKLQESENRAEITFKCRASGQHVSASPVRSRCSGINEPLSQLLNPGQTPSPPRTPSPVRPLFQYQEASTPQSQIESHVSSRMPNLESYLAVALSQHINQDKAVIQDRNQIPKRCMMSPETQCFTETRNPQVSRMISVVKPPRQRSPFRIWCQSDSVHANEEEKRSSVNNPFGVGNESNLLAFTQTADAFEPQLQTSSLTVSHMETEKTSRQISFSKESQTDSFSAMEMISVMEPNITQRQTVALEPPSKYDFSQSRDEADSQKPITTDLEAHAVEVHTSEEEKIPLSSQNSNLRFSANSPVLQTQIPSDYPENFTGKNPLIGLEAVIRCESVDGSPPLCCYLCQLCSLKLRKKKIFSHLIGCQHQHNYIKVFHPEILTDMKRKHCNLNEKLEKVAMQLEKEDGRGQIKVMRLSACLISEVLHKDYHWCIKVLNCGASVETFKKKKKKNTGPSQAPKRTAESMQSPFDNDSAPLSTNQISKKTKKADPTNVTFTKNIKDPVFKVSLSSQEGPIVIERAPLRVTDTVAPEIEDQILKRPYTENNALSLWNNAHSGNMSTCIHGCPLVVPDPAEFWVQPSLGHKDWGSLEETVSLTYTDWSVQDWSGGDDNWTLQEQVTEDRASDYPEDTRYMWY